MSTFIDLHFHSHYSEGDSSPAAIVARAAEQNIQVMALTDHNTIAGVPNFIEAAVRQNITAITGVELYVRHGNQPLHLLGYNFDMNNAMLNERLEFLRQDNHLQLQRSVSALQNRGFTIDIRRILSTPSENYGAIHILREMERYPENIQKINNDLPNHTHDFFAKINHYFGHNSPAAFRLSEIPATEALDSIHAAGGFASLAHPGQQLAHTADAVIAELQAAGLDAIEVLSPYHSWHQIERYQHLALETGLLITGGSDFHGTIEQGRQAPISRQWDYFRTPKILYRFLRERFTNLP